MSLAATWMEDASTPAADDWLREPGDHDVDVPVVCVLTRFGLRNALHLLQVRRDYRRVLDEARQAQTPGLLRSAFLIEAPTACFSLSIWTGRDAIAHFGTTVPTHVDVANRVFPRVSLDPEEGPEIWSTKWRLVSVSNNLNWEGFDFRSLLIDCGARP